MAAYPCSDVNVDPRSLVRIGEALLQRVQQVYHDAGIELPPRREWIMGDGVYDCEKLMVAFTGLREGMLNTESGPQSPCDVPVNATFQVTVVRCAAMPDDRGNPPDLAELTARTNASVIDAYLLMKASCKLDMYGADVIGLHPGALGGMGVEATVDVAEPQGGFQAVTLNLTTVIG